LFRFLRSCRSLTFLFPNSETVFGKVGSTKIQIRFNRERVLYRQKIFFFFCFCEERNMSIVAKILRENLDDGFVRSSTMIVASEIGDKTFFIAAVMAMTEKRVEVGFAFFL